MKIYSDNAVTKDDLTAIDAKQDRQINQLRIMTGVAFAFNVVLALALKFL